MNYNCGSQLFPDRQDEVNGLKDVCVCVCQDELFPQHESIYSKVIERFKFLKYS